MCQLDLLKGEKQQLKPLCNLIWRVSIKDCYGVFKGDIIARGDGSVVLCIYVSCQREWGSHSACFHAHPHV